MAVADLADQLLGGGRGDRAGLVEQGQLALHGLVQAFGLDQLVDQADAQRGVGVEMLAGGEPAAGLARADGFDHIGRDHRRQQAQAAFGQAEAGRGAGDGDVAAGDQADAAAEGRAMDPARVGLGSSSRVRISRARASESSRLSASLAAAMPRIHCMSAPAEKEAPWPASTTARTEASWPAASSAAVSRAISPASKALCSPAGSARE